MQKIGEGWFSRVYLTELRSSRKEIVLKAINSNLVTADEFWREYKHAQVHTPPDLGHDQGEQPLIFLCCSFFPNTNTS